MIDLFDDGTKPSTPEKDELRFDWLVMFCREKYGIPEGWRWYSWQRKEFDKPHEFMLLEGAVCDAVFERGKRKGQTDWKKRDKSTERTFVIPRADLDAFQRAWQDRTGRCFECYGTGEKWVGWSAEKGARYAPCHHCDATGKATARAA